MTPETVDPETGEIRVPLDDEGNELAPVEEVVVLEKTQPAPVWDRTWAEVEADLHQKIPPAMVKKRQQGGTWLDYIEWTTAKRILDYYARGYSVYHRELHYQPERSYTFTAMSGAHKGEERTVIIPPCVSSITEIHFPCRDGHVVRSGIGAGELDQGYGEASKRAERDSFKRAAANAGVAFYLYMDD